MLSDAIENFKQLRKTGRVAESNVKDVVTLASRILPNIKGAIPFGDLFDKIDPEVDAIPAGSYAKIYGSATLGTEPSEFLQNLLPNPEDIEAIAKQSGASVEEVTWVGNLMACQLQELGEKTAAYLEDPTADNRLAVADASHDVTQLSFIVMSQKPKSLQKVASDFDDFSSVKSALYDKYPNIVKAGSLVQSIGDLEDFVADYAYEVQHDNLDIVTPNKFIAYLEANEPSFLSEVKEIITSQKDNHKSQEKYREAHTVHKNQLSEEFNDAVLDYMHDSHISPSLYFRMVGKDFIAEPKEHLPEWYKDNAQMIDSKSAEGLEEFREKIRTQKMDEQPVSSQSTSISR